MEDNTLKRTMKLHQLVIFGVAFLTPMIAYTIYGVIANASHGVESGSICFAVIAMLFTALSYGHMAKAYPAAGSTYTYTRKAINSKLGVIAGWIVLLGYVFFPMAIWLIGASYFSAAVPAVPLLPGNGKSSWILPPGHRTRTKSAHSPARCICPHRASCHLPWLTLPLLCTSRKHLSLTV